MSAMTEEEARNRLCPMSFAIPEIRTDDGCGVRGGGPWMCAASGCLGWRWWDGLSDDGTACHHTPTRMAPRVPETPEGRPLAERRGYCGLAGSIRP
jgi:hypothetical protein